MNRPLSVAALWRRAVLKRVLEPYAPTAKKIVAPPMIKLVAAVVARIAEREQAVGVNLRVAEADEAVGDRHVVVLDHDAGVGFPPRRVPRAHVVAAERPLDARLPERAGHDAVELAASAERDDARVRSEVVHDPDEDSIAFLPVLAHHVKPQTRSTAPGPGRRRRQGCRLGSGRPTG